MLGSRLGAVSEVALNLRDCCENGTMWSDVSLRLPIPQRDIDQGVPAGTASRSNRNRLERTRPYLNGSISVLFVTADGLGFRSRPSIFSQASTLPRALTNAVTRAANQFMVISLDFATR